MFWLHFSSHAVSEEVEVELVDTGMLTNKHGQGIEMRLKASVLPLRGPERKALERAVMEICKTLAPKVIPFVIENTGLSKPEFISVRVTSGNSIFGRYFQKVFTIEGNTCGKGL